MKRRVVGMFFLCAAMGTLLGAGLVGCSAEEPDQDLGSTAGEGDDGESGSEESLESAVIDVSETGDPRALAPQPLDVNEVEGFLDVRGVGDAAWSSTHESPARAADYGKALDTFDRSGTSYRGHLSFINWETVVGDRCNKFFAPYVRGKNYAFVSRADNLTQAYDRGFNLIALSNNHTRDCYDDAGERRGPAMTLEGMASVDEGKDWLWAGVAPEADKRKAVVREFDFGGRRVKVAFASAYTGRPTCPMAACKGDIEPLMQSLAEADAELRILALHSMAKADQAELARLGVRFVEVYGGDVVFGHGPHVWSRVQVARKPDGKPGVVFESLGNFIHPGLGSQTRNIIGRALFDESSLELKQVQVVPISGAGARMNFASSPNLADPQLVGNVRFTGSAAIRGGYVNIRATR